jgi:hypothetical protein
MLDILEELCDKVLHPDDWFRHPDLVHQVILRRPAIFPTFPLSSKPESLPYKSE